MCGRFFLKATPAEVTDFFDVPVRDNFPARYNIAPTQPVAMIRQSVNRSREYALARWGFIPSWAKADYLKKLASRPLINARAETVADKPTFRSAYKRRRCLVPANGFYEWKTEKDGKQPFCFEQENAALFAFGGLWETAVDPDGGELDTLTLLTTEAGKDVEFLHHREPVVIAREHFSVWLEADERDIGMLDDLLRAAPPGTWSARAVSKAVNSVRNDGPSLIEPIGVEDTS